MNATDSSVPLPADTKASVVGKKFRWARVLTMVTVAAVVGLVALVLIRFGNLETFLTSLTRPRLVPAGGRVLYQGKPLIKAQIMTYPVASGGIPAIGWTNEAGEFKLQTDIDGSYVEGATVGEHRVTVAAFQPASGPGAPALLTPQQYSSEATSPLRITIRSNPNDNQFQLALEGELPGGPQSASKGGGKGKQGKGRDKAKTGSPIPPDPLEAGLETEGESTFEPFDGRDANETRADGQGATTAVDGGASQP